MMRKKVQTVLTQSVLISGFLGFMGCAQEDLLPVAGPESRQTGQQALSLMERPPITRSSSQYLVIGTSNSLPADLESQAMARKGVLTNWMKEVGLATVSSTDPDFATKAAGIPGVRSVIRDLRISWFSPGELRQVAADAGSPPSSGDNDFFYDLQWGHDAINSPEAWNAGYRGQGVRVAVLDTGFDLTHPDLAANLDLAASRNFVPGEQLQYKLPDVFSHGTHTAGIIAAADNGFGVIGVAPQARLILVKVLADKGQGNFSWMLNGIVHAVNQGADVINMSLGTLIPRNGRFLDDNGTPEDPGDDFVVSDTKAVQELLVATSRITTWATQQGVTLIASAGNDAVNGNQDRSLVSLPADAPHVLSVSATAPIGWAMNGQSSLDHLASYSNFGTPEVDFAAPGGDGAYTGTEMASVGGLLRPAFVFDYVFSTGNAGWFWSAGTSMAAPHVSGVAALIIGKNGGQMDPAQVEAALRASSDDLGKPGRDPAYGYGRVNAFRAVSIPLLPAEH